MTPGPMVIVMSLTATTLPYQRETFRSSMAVLMPTPAFRYLTARPPRLAASSNSNITP